MKRPVFAGTLAVAVTVWLLLCLGVIDVSYRGIVPDGETVTVTGRVDFKEWKGERLILGISDPQCSGWDIMCYVDDVSAEPSIGMIVKVSGEARAFSRAENPGEFDSLTYYTMLKRSWRMYETGILAMGGEEDRFREFLYSIRRKAGLLLERYMSPGDAGVCRAVILGDKGDLDEETRELFTKGGIMHILAVSGLHITILGMGLYRLLRKMRAGKLLSACLAVIMMYSYGVMCGMSASACRAVIMFGIRLYAPVCRRTYDMLTGLAIAALLLIAGQPAYVNDTGFRLSFGAVMAVGLLVPELIPLQSIQERTAGAGAPSTGSIIADKVLPAAFTGLRASIGIAVFTLPVYAMAFHTFPIYSPLVNLAVLPLMTVLVLLLIICLAAGVIMPILARISGILIHMILMLYRGTCALSSGLPFNTWYMGHTNVLKAVVYMFLIAAFIYVSRYLREKMLTSQDKISGIMRDDREHMIRQLHDLSRLLDVCRYLILAFAVILLCAGRKSALKITFLSVGQGDGIVVESGGKAYMIDGGSSDRRSLYKYQIKPFLAYEGISSLEAVIISHEDEDHMSGIKDMISEMDEGGIRIRNLILPDVAADCKGDNYILLEKAAAERGIPVSYIHRGEYLDTGELSTLCIGPYRGCAYDEANEHSTLLYLRLGAFSALLTGDVEGEGQEELRSIIRSNPGLCRDLTLLKVAHHGSRFTTDEEFLELVRPRYAVISAGTGKTRPLIPILGDVNKM